MLFHRGTAPYPIVWAEFWKCLRNKKVPLGVHHCHRAVFATANTVFFNDEDNANAMDLAQEIVNGTIFQNGGSGFSTQTCNLSIANKKELQGIRSTRKTAHNVSMRLNSDKKRFQTIWLSPGKIIAMHTSRFWKITAWKPHRNISTCKICCAKMHTDSFYTWWSPLL